MNNDTRNVWLTDLFDNRKCRVPADAKPAQKHKFQYMGADVCCTCIAACIGVCPTTIERSRRKRARGESLKRKRGTGIRVPVIRTDSFPGIIDFRIPSDWTNLENGTRRRESDAKFQENQAPVPREARADRHVSKAFDLNVFFSRVKQATVTGPALDVSDSYLRSTWRIALPQVKCSSASTFGLFCL